MDARFCVKNDKHRRHVWNSVSVAGSAERWQAKELWLKFFHAPEPQSGLLGEGGIHVVVGNHHHLHPRRHRRPDAVGSVFKHQTLGKDKGEENKVTLSPKPIRSTGFRSNGPRSAVSGKTNPGERESALAAFPFSCEKLDISSE